MNVEKTIKTITEGIKKRTDIAVMGLSGGADSTLVAILCKLALGKENVYGVHMPYDTKDFDTFNFNSQILSRHLEIKDMICDIEEAVREIADQSTKIKFALEKNVGTSKLNLGNLKARVRTTTLYTVNQTISENIDKICRVVGTGNISEDFIGYDTKGGDALADFFPIGDLFKSEVYELLDYFIGEEIILEEHVNRIPSAGLWDGQTDEEELGYTYDEMQPAIEFLLNRKCFGNDSSFLWSTYDELILYEENNVPNLDILEFVWSRYLNNKHKHEAPDVIKLR